jgi:hypothetical protein
MRFHQDLDLIGTEGTKGAEGAEVSTAFLLTHLGSRKFGILESRMYASFLIQDNAEQFPYV